MHGADFLACSNKSRTREAPTPAKTSTNSEAEMLKKGTPASPATAFANKVLPVPGASNPHGNRVCLNMSRVSTKQSWTWASDVFWNLRLWKWFLSQKISNSGAFLGSQFIDHSITTVPCRSCLSLQNQSPIERTQATWKQHRRDWMSEVSTKINTSRIHTSIYDVNTSMPSLNKFSERQSAAIHLCMNHQVIDGNSPIHQTPPLTIPEPQPGAPGGPTNNAPLGILAPSSEYLARTSCSVRIEVTPMEFLTRQNRTKDHATITFNTKSVWILGLTPNEQRVLKIRRRLNKREISRLTVGHLDAFFKKSTTSTSSVLAPSQPATSPNFTCEAGYFSIKQLCIGVFVGSSDALETPLNQMEFVNCGYYTDTITLKWLDITYANRKISTWINRKAIVSDKKSRPSLINVPNNLPINPSIQPSNTLGRFSAGENTIPN